VKLHAEYSGSGGHVEQQWGLVHWLAGMIFWTRTCSVLFRDEIASLVAYLWLLSLPRS
jgi:hypothetical protein